MVTIDIWIDVYIQHFKFQIIFLKINSTQWLVYDNGRSDEFHGYVNHIYWLIKMIEHLAIRH